MKHIIKLSALAAILFVGIGFSGCKDDDFTPTIFDTKDYPLDRDIATFPLDTFIKVNFLEPYNMKFIYRMEDIGSDLQKNLTPASYAKSVELAVLSKYLWYDIYNELSKQENPTFLQENSPRIIHVIGSKNYNPSQGTEILGVAEGGLKITLYNTNNLNVRDIDMMNEYFFKTMHHEFAHILDQTHLRPTSFNTISNGHYDASTWQNTPDSVAAGSGFVSPYASSAAREDWAEVIANYITRDTVSWERLLGAASYDWEEVDCNSLADYNKLITPGCNLDTIGYFKESKSGSDHKIYRRMCERNADGSVALDANGNVVWTHKSGIDGQAIILQKIETARKWMQDYYHISIDDLRKAVQRRQYATNPDGTFKRNSLGRLVNALTEPTVSDPSVTIIDSLVNEVNEYKKLMPSYVSE